GSQLQSYLLERAKQVWRGIRVLRGGGRRRSKGRQLRGIGSKRDREIVLSAKSGLIHDWLIQQVALQYMGNFPYRPVPDVETDSMPPCPSSKKQSRQAVGIGFALVDFRSSVHLRDRVHR